MPHLLQLDAAANRDPASVSRRLTARFADRWKEVHGSVSHRHHDLAAEPVAPIDTAFCRLGRRVEATGGVARAEVAAFAVDDEERRAWAATEPVVDELRRADVVVMGAPMYNLGIPAALKAWIDRVSFPGALDDLRVTDVVVVSPRGGAYGPGAPRHGLDFVVPALTAWWGDRGVPSTRVAIVEVEMTVADVVPHLRGFRSHAARSLEAAEVAVSALAERLAVPTPTG